MTLSHPDGFGGRFYLHVLYLQIGNGIGQFRVYGTKSATARDIGSMADHTILGIYQQGPTANAPVHSMLLTFALPGYDSRVILFLPYQIKMVQLADGRTYSDAAPLSADEILKLPSAVRPHLAWEDGDNDAWLNESLRVDKTVLLPLE